MEPQTALTVVAYTAPVTFALLSALDGWSAGSLFYDLRLRKAVQWVALLTIVLSWMLLSRVYPDQEFPVTQFMYVYLFSIWVSFVVRPVFFIISYRVAVRRKLRQPSEVDMNQE